ncbi:protein kinase, putative [Bodo saltans]|uniref:Protein kinase, putative n=1 Tax=Bodo saltans TaxID=75058 RepID=A0A0S4J3W2_BODSA|nr:protein kinase, putative [Bodo saltans]|eukprot:CUG86125.1 protein kinase, putative [Bodo saltans]
MPIGGAEHAVIYKGSAVFRRGSTGTPPPPPSPATGPQPVSPATPQAAAPSSFRDPPKDKCEKGGDKGGEMFHSILRFLHLDSGLPHRAKSETLHEEHPPSHTPQTAPRSADYDDRTDAIDASTASFMTNHSMSSAHRNESELVLDEHCTTSRQSSSHPHHHATTSNPPKKKRRSTIKAAFTSLFFPNERKKKPSPLPQQNSAGQSDDTRAFAVILEIDEDDEREDILHTEATILDILLLNFRSDLKVLKERTVWDSETGGEVSDEQLHTMYYLFFRQMKSLLSQQFSQIFPHGIRGTALSMSDVSACVAGLLMIEMAITDDDVHSFAFNVLQGRRISLQNCPPSKRYLYFMFMALKSLVPIFRSHTDAFRSAVVKYFYDHNSIKKAGHPFALPLQALLNALAPILMAHSFQKMTPSFYYYALKLEREREGGDEEDDILTDEAATPLKPDGESTSNNESVSRSCSDCPPSKRYLYFMFMALKSLVPIFRSHTDAFRSAVVKYFYDHNSIKKAGHPFALPLQALLNALAPILMAHSFQKMTPSFYYYALKLEREREGGDEEDDILTDEAATPLKPDGESTSNNESVSRSCSEEYPAPASGTPHQSATPKEAVAQQNVASASGSPTFATATTSAPRRRRRGASAQWSTIVQTYKKGQVLGRGACGVVYRCTDANNGVFYALKELSLLTKSMVRRIRRHQEDQLQLEDEGAFNSSTATAPGTPMVRLDQILTEKEQEELMWREKSICGEVNMLKSLRNPYIVSYYGCAFDRKSLKVSILMEFCPKTLRAIIDELGAMRLSMIAHYATQILLGIAFLHDNHVVHRDIKAANILVKDGGEAKVSDFGTAILNEIRGPDAGLGMGEDELDALRRETENAEADDLTTLFTSNRSNHPHHSHHGKGKQHPKSHQNGTHAFSIQGTSLFLAPEVANGCLPTEASDVWSIGCLLIEMATGEYPWHEWTDGRDLPLEMVVFHVAMAQQPPLLSQELAPHAASNPLFVDLLRSCLHIDPVARPTCRQLLQHPFFKQADFGEHDDPDTADAEGSGSERDPLMTVDESGELDDDAVLGGNVMSIVPNDSMIGPSGVYDA